MPTTIYRLAEQIQRRIVGGNVPDSAKVEIEEIMIFCGQKLNELLKTEYMSVNIGTGELIPNGTMMGLYEGVVVEKYKNRSAAKLPIKPVKLPRNMGVWSVWLSSDPDCEFIPMQMSESSLLNDQPLISGLLGHIGYEVYGNQVVFTRDLTVDGEEVTVDMRLAIMDISQYTIYEPLPVLPEMEAAVIEAGVKMFAQPIPSDKLVDPTGNEQQIAVANQIQN